MNSSSLNKDTILKSVELLNQDLKSTGITIKANIGHILGRFNDRDLDAIDFYNCIKDFRQRNLALFVYYANLDRKDIPFKIFLTAKDIIIHMALEDDKVWKIATVLDPKDHNRHREPTKFTQYILLDECA